MLHNYINIFQQRADEKTRLQFRKKTIVKSITKIRFVNTNRLFGDENKT